MGERGTERLVLRRLQAQRLLGLVHRGGVAVRHRQQRRLALRPAPTRTASSLQGRRAPLPRRERRVVGLGDRGADAEAAQCPRGEREQARAANRARGGLVGGVASAPGHGPPPAAPERISSRHAGALGVAGVGPHGLAFCRVVGVAPERLTISVLHNT
jgi:hypothetical protein